MGEILGFKCFKADLKNKYGEQFILGVEKRKTKELKFGKNGHGFHFCINLEDTFRYFNPTKENVCCKVEGYRNTKTRANFRICLIL